MLVCLLWEAAAPDSLGARGRRSRRRSGRRSSSDEEADVESCSWRVAMRGRLPACGDAMALLSPCGDAGTLASSIHASAPQRLDEARRLWWLWQQQCKRMHLRAPECSNCQELIINFHTPPDMMWLSRSDSEVAGSAVASSPASTVSESATDSSEEPIESSSRGHSDARGQTATEQRLNSELALLSANLARHGVTLDPRVARGYIDKVVQAELHARELIDEEDAEARARPAAPCKRKKKRGRKGRGHRHRR